MKFGTEAQKLRYLRAIAAGELLWCQGFSEPEAGTDLGNMKTRAEPDDDGYVVNGSKIWTSYAARADVMVLLARVGGQGNGGVSCFIVSSEERRVGKECVSTCRSRCSQDNLKKKK